MDSDLFSNPADAERYFLPLATRMRPTKLEEYVGQQHILGDGQLLAENIKRGQVHSMVFWGPPGVGKTTLAKMIAQYASAAFIEISAVLSGVKDIREAIDQAKNQKIQHQKQTCLFVDEVHRFNKSQQDAFLPHIENGDILFIGATTENPSFELNSALLSRCRVYVLKPLDDQAIAKLIERALKEDSILKHLGLTIANDALSVLIDAADGDARRALNFIEIAADFLSEGDEKVIDIPLLNKVIAQSYRRFDKSGEVFYDQISALHKSIRGSSPDAAIYWLNRMLDGGCDPLYLARRLVRTASEDIGNADPRALQVTMDAWQVQERLGSPEGELALAQAAIYLAVAPKSNAVYKAFNRVNQCIRETGTKEVPMHLRNAPTKLMKEQGYSEGYRYPHDEPNAFSPGVNYLPDGLTGSVFYEPTDRGLEKKIKEKLAYLKKLNKSTG